MTLPRFDYGNEVRLIRNVRNDGTFPGEETGMLLVPRGEVGYVHDVGTFLQDQIIYRVHFFNVGRTVGCREEELIEAKAPWIPNRFEFRDKVIAIKDLAVQGCIVVSRGTEGSIEKVIREAANDVGGIQYHVYFGNDCTLQVPEKSLDALMKEVDDVD